MGERAGNLDRQITFKKRIKGAKDDFGDPTYTDWSLGPLFAAVSFVSDGERMRAAQPSSTITHRFQVRWSPKTAEIDATAAIHYGGKIYEIIGAPKEIGRRDRIEFSATAKADGR